MSSHQHTSDELPGVLQRKSFLERVEVAIAVAQTTGAPFALCLLDLARLNVINDMHGHGAANAILKEVASRLRNVLLSDDSIGRIGGAEFGVLLAGADEERSHRAAGKMRRALEQPMEVGGTTVTPYISLGIARYPAHGATAEALVRYADQDVERFKRERRDSA